LAWLKLYRRTQDITGLQQAHILAMAALPQSQQAYQAAGDWYDSLWTVDAGLACLLWACLQLTAALPG
jgi:hypothetical protein